MSKIAALFVSVLLITTTSGAMANGSAGEPPKLPWDRETVLSKSQELAKIAWNTSARANSDLGGPYCGEASYHLDRVDQSVSQFRIALKRHGSMEKSNMNFNRILIDMRHFRTQGGLCQFTDLTQPWVEKLEQSILEMRDYYPPSKW